MNDESALRTEDGADVDWTREYAQGDLLSEEFELHQLAALDRYDVPAQTQPAPASSDTGDNPLTLLFTVTNPTNTVSVTASISGQLHSVSLSPSVARMTETCVADEISLLAQLASTRACAAQHALIATLMTDRGHDPALIRAYLELEAGLPSPETAQAAIADVFARRYDRGSW